MNITTNLSCGDTAWVFTDNGPQTVTVGQVRIEYTSSKGIDGSMFGNYQAQKGFKEQYMCVETGIGSGTVWEFGKSIFLDEAACIEANEQRIVELKRHAEEERLREIVMAQRKRDDANKKLRELGAA